MCSSKPPKPDPLIGQTAKQNADIAQQQLDVAKQQLEWERDRASVQDPLIQKIVDQQIASGDANATRAESQWQIYRDLFAPVEERMVKDADEFDSQARKDRMAAEAGGDVVRGYQAAREASQRSMERMGINPNSGRFQALALETNLGLAKDTAGAMNKARRDTELQGMAMRQGTAQFGRNMPTTGIATDAAALNAGNSATGNRSGPKNLNKPISGKSATFYVPCGALIWSRKWQKERDERTQLAIGDGYRESEASWKEVLLDLKARGLKVDPKLAVGDGALGF